MQKRSETTRFGSSQANPYKEYLFAVFGFSKESNILQVVAGAVCGLTRFSLVSRSEKGVFWKRGLCRKSLFLVILENLEILEILENPQKKRRIRPFSRHSRECRDSRDSSGEKTPFIMNPFSGPDSKSLCLRPGSRQKFLESNFWGWGWGHLRTVLHCQ